MPRAITLILAFHSDLNNLSFVYRCLTPLCYLFSGQGNGIGSTGNDIGSPENGIGSAGNDITGQGNDIDNSGNDITGQGNDVGSATRLYFAPSQ